MKKRKYNHYDNRDIIKFVPEVQSCAGLLRKLNLKPVGGNYTTIKKKLSELKIDRSHWRGQGWSKGKKLKKTDEQELLNWLTYNSKYSSNKIRKKLIELNIKKDQCEKCKLKTWLDKPIVLELHHVNGDRTNNCIWNLQILCPNCHAYVHMTNRKLASSRKVVSDQDLIDAILSTETKAEALKKCGLKPTYYLRINAIIDKHKVAFVKKPIIKKQISEDVVRKELKTKIVWPDKLELESLIQNNSMRSVGKKLGVSDNAVRKRCKKYQIDFINTTWAKRHRP
jgi:hypothetical protein